MDVSDLCTFCRIERETIQHLLVTCTEVNAMWKLVKDMIRERVNVTMELSLEEIVLGFKPDTYDCLNLTAKVIQRLLQGVPKLMAVFEKFVDPQYKLFGMTYILKNHVRGHAWML